MTALTNVQRRDRWADWAVIGLVVVALLAGVLLRNAESLNLNYIDLGDSDVLELGDIVQILGHPTIGGQTITFTEGVVSGFTKERGVDGRAYIKTDATIAGGNSGGLGADMTGKLIGVPTQVGYGGAQRFADCRYLADTNNDGKIDQSDNCIPVGGFINAMRPANLAKPLVESARLGIAQPERRRPSAPQPSGDARFYNLLFSSGITDNDQPTGIITGLPSGATELYAFWEYEEMARGGPWEARWYKDGEYLENVSWPPGGWQGDTSGSWWISVYNDDGLADGTYTLALYVGEELSTEASIEIGGNTAGSGPLFSDLVFSEGITSDERPTNPSYLLPSGIDEVYAFFDFEGMENGLDFYRIWSYEGEEIASGIGSWTAGSSGSGWVSLVLPIRPWRRGATGWNSPSKALPSPQPRSPSPAHAAGVR